MHRDFGVMLNIPSNRLCPPVPNRMNYVLWIQDIVHAHHSVLGSRPRKIRGIDIGTGATAIYPFLACKLEPTWELVGTELDDESFESARINVSSNDMQSRIDVQKASNDGLILFPLEESDENFEFSMCNPPFYESALEISQLAQEKELPPNAVCTGADIEMIYPNRGEAGFVERMVEESERFQTRCKWYTSMLGKMTSVSSIVQALRTRSINNYAITEFVQGQTRRWAIAWSFTDTHLPDSIARIPSISSKHALYSVMPPRNTLSQPFPNFGSDTIYSAVSEVLRSIDGVSATELSPPLPAAADSRPGCDSLSAEADNVSDNSVLLFFVEAQGNTWSRSARRSRHRQSEDKAKDVTSRTDQPTVPKPALTCSCRVTGASDTEFPSGNVAGGDAAVYSVEFQWVFGSDRSLFESFVGHVGRKVGLALQGGKSRRNEDPLPG
ncbi:hypothetical protein GALMADRAFT_251373 [Galerina marginata CBS 339.88]|uniref:U6 small nuclear RNA (adenine-(43)-N(6))-methyltransferase n=1 Tax=Galerina marginata (strain CBS 339.88) TaxID=685588 RepID=A0A067T114_GALM3|nr:hypothetical protein GALMADRAFT_251373 [Galerina marginata CBS 339.88]